MAANRRSNFDLVTLVAGVYFFIASNCYAQNQDIAQQVTNILNAYGPVEAETLQVATASPKDSVEYGPVCEQQNILMQHAVNGDVFKLEADNYFKNCVVKRDSLHVRVHGKAILSASNIVIVSSTAVKFTEQTQTGFPDRLDEHGETWVNCSDQPVEHQDTLSVDFQTSSSIEISESVTNTNQLQIGAEWSPVKDVVKISAQVTISRATTEGKATTNGSQTTVTRSSQISATVPPRSEIGAAMETWPIVYTTKFSATITIDADISKNDKGILKLSEIAPVEKRTFPVSGTITYTGASDGKSVTYNVPFDEVNDCPHSNVPFDRKIKVTPLKNREGRLLISLPPSEKSNSNLRLRQP